jgi:SAM-dependent methyltransferase
MFVDEELSIMHELLKYATSEPIVGPVPDYVADRLAEGAAIVEQVSEVIGSGTHGAYFEVSRQRYAHYFATVLSQLQAPAVVLDIGNAPGHAAIGLSLLGHTVRGLNLNADWRNTYPSGEWYDRFDVVEHDIEAAPLPFPDASFDAVIFTEVLEHIGITHPRQIVAEFRRVLKPDGIVIFSTPNVCNLSNLYALMKGTNIFWSPEMFYGSLDRHNREFTPAEADAIMAGAGLTRQATWGLNDYSNWRPGGSEFAQAYISRYGDQGPMARNTTTGIYRRIN